ncbi:ion transporter [uncultured Roseivirga sp.]|uniref:ion transporter n=1 Tax=uncultured Roseivirga sp. TaxID=543088 RepID=UPI000D78E918|nr:ion transporter [uncultured Roseivirga sp.]PWL29000.1 MAG: ion transporter [Roseivirga sp. XM-24bin3]
MKKKKLRALIEDNTSKSGKAFDYFIQALILTSLLTFSLGTLPNLKSSSKSLLETIELGCIIAFTVEYLLRIYVAKNPLKYIFSFYGLIDLMAILPFYLRVSIDLRALRVFRVFRIFRALKLIRYNRALHRFHIAARLVKEEMILFFIVTAIMIFLTASGIYFFENKAQPEVFSSVFHSFWWSIVTLTTVGYGDVYPITVGGKIFTFFVLVIGIGVVTVPAGLVATALTKAREIEESERKKQRVITKSF